MNDEIILRLEAHTQSLAMNDITQQNAETHRMLQILIDRQC